MSTFRKWAFWRRVQYGFGFFLFVVFLVGGLYLLLRDTSYSCFDGVQNGEETGIDCGGGCVRICNATVLPPKIIWATSFEIVEGQYNALAYVENLNDVAATAELKYTFEFYNGSTLITTRSGSTIFPPNSVYPIFEGRIQTGAQEITDTKLILEPVEIWQPASVGREQFRSSQINLSGADTRPRLDVTMENTELTAADDVEVVATLFNDAGEPVTASQTFMEYINERSRQDIVFTWPNPIARTVRSCIIPTDVILAIDLSGSMNNDGGTPPQPITDTLIAAGEFVARLGEKDQAGVVTFASNASTNSPLTKNHLTTAGIINNLAISPAEETGFTNTAAALEAANAELSSPRHNEDARRVVVLLTDGLPTGTGEQSAVIEATKAKANELIDAGVTIYAVGLGANVDQEFIRSLVPGPEYAFNAPTRSDLSAIYQTITTSLCESGTAKIDIVAKTKANFTPLR